MQADSPQQASWRDRLGRAWDSARSAPGRRRLVLRGSVVLVVIVILFVVPGYVASQPRFLQRYAGLAAPYKTWSTSVHARVSCQQCHAAPTFAGQARYDMSMLGQFYLSIVAPSRQPDLFSAPPSTACRNCHVDLRTVSPAGDVKIPHAAHVNVLKIPCVRCHRYLVHQTNADGTHHPAMATCLACHDGRTAKNTCPTCHTNKGFPLSHRAANWVVIHPLMQQKIDCTKCHKWTPDWCAACHAKRPRSHVADWRAVHGLAVDRHRDCEVCHAAAFCTRCHGTVPKRNFNPALKPVSSP